MKLKLQKMMAKTMLWSLLLNAFAPALLFATETEEAKTRSYLHSSQLNCRKNIHAHKVTTDTLCVKKDATICGDLTVKGKIHADCPISCDNVVDYIVIGMGAAGAVIARRLTDDLKTSVIGLEAGDNNSDEFPVFDPAIAFPLTDLFYPNYFWQGQGTPQEQLAAPFQFGPSFLLTQGRLLGGGTSVNGLQVVRGSNSYWSNMAALLGPDWSLDKTLARYNELETYVTPCPPSPGRGTNGPWINTALPFDPTQDANFLITSMEAVSGVPTVCDYNDPAASEVTQFARTDYQERFIGEPLLPYIRVSTATAFLGSDVITPEGVGVNGRKLRVHLRSTAIDLIWNKNKVIGVRYSQDGECYDIFAREEVIVSAGYQSAAFLQRNGIGPKEVLQAAGVPVRVPNDNVGTLINHVGFFTTISSDKDLELTAFDQPWVVYGPGAFYPSITPVGDPETATRDIQWLSLQLGPQTFGMIPLLITPKSVGTIAIQNDDPFKIPLIDQKYLTDPADIDALVNASFNFLKDLNEFFANNPSPNGGTWRLDPPFRGPIENSDRDELEALIRQTLIQTFHYCATCKAGSSPDIAVVDPYGRVFGVEGLRVADVSILPYIPDGNTATPGVLVGWTISEFIQAGQ